MVSSYKEKPEILCLLVLVLCAAATVAKFILLCLFMFTKNTFSNSVTVLFINVVVTVCVGLMFFGPESSVPHHAFAKIVVVHQKWTKSTQKTALT